jgi:drug/metabolite transporter (DMT)-like permease
LIRKRGVPWILASIVLYVFYVLALRGMQNDPSGGETAGQLNAIWIAAIVCGLIGVFVFVVDLMHRRKKDHD